LPLKKLNSGAKTKIFVQSPTKIKILKVGVASPPLLLIIILMIIILIFGNRLINLITLKINNYLINELIMNKKEHNI